MSEPYSLAIFAHIDPNLFRNNLKAELLPLTAFADWAALGQDVSVSDLADAQTATPSSPLRYLQELRDASIRQYGWHFEHDASSGYLTCHCLLWTDRMPEILSGFNVLRQLLTSSGGRGFGYIVAHGFVFAANQTSGGVIIDGSNSQVLPPEDDQIKAAVAHARPMAEMLIEQANAVYEQGETPISPVQLLTDQLESLAGI